MEVFEVKDPLRQSNLLVHNRWWIVLALVPTSRRSVVLVTRLAARSHSSRRSGGSKMVRSMVLEWKSGHGSEPGGEVGLSALLRGCPGAEEEAVWTRSNVASGSSSRTCAA